MEEAWKLDWTHLPAAPTALVRSSCKELLQKNPHVSIDSAALDAFVDSLKDTRLLSLPQKQYPLRFKSNREEINFLCTLALLQFGSGWRKQLHASGSGKEKGKGAAETITFGCIGMHLTGEITAHSMANITLFEIAQTFNIRTHEEYFIQPGIRSERPTELFALADAIKKTLNDTGNMLRSVSDHLTASMRSIK